MLNSCCCRVQPNRFGWMELAIGLQESSPTFLAYWENEMLQVNAADEISSEAGRRRDCRLQQQTLIFLALQEPHVRHVQQRRASVKRRLRITPFFDALGWAIASFSSVQCQCFLLFRLCYPMVGRENFFTSRDRVICPQLYIILPNNQLAEELIAFLSNPISTDWSL
jgi:hypothetical protein